MLENLATLSRLNETLLRRKRAFSRAVYYQDEPQIRRLQADIRQLRRIILLRQEFFELIPSGDVLTIDRLFERYS